MSAPSGELTHGSSALPHVMRTLLCSSPASTAMMVTMVMTVLATELAPICYSADKGGEGEGERERDLHHPCKFRMRNSDNATQQAAWLAVLHGRQGSNFCGQLLTGSKWCYLQACSILLKCGGALQDKRKCRKVMFSTWASKSWRAKMTDVKLASCSALYWRYSCSEPQSAGQQWMVSEQSDSSFMA